MKIIILISLFFSFGVTHANVFDSDDRKVFIPSSKPWLAVGKLEMKMDRGQ